MNWLKFMIGVFIQPLVFFGSIYYEVTMFSPSSIEGIMIILLTLLSWLAIVLIDRDWLLSEDEVKSETKTGVKP
jgi:hypothetical protein